MPPDKIYLIHYTKLPERLARIKPTLDNCGIPYEIITEYDKQEINADTLFGKFTPNVEEFNRKISTLWDSNIHKYRHINYAEISCTMKHFSAMQKISKECVNYGMVIEDDAIFSPDFAKLFANNLNYTPSNWDAVFFGDGCGTSMVADKLNHKSSVRVAANVWQVGHPASNCTEAYLIKPGMAGKMCAMLPFSLVIDWEMAYMFYKNNATVYWWTPPLVTQGSKTGMYPSELDIGQRKG